LKAGFVELLMHQETGELFGKKGVDKSAESTIYVPSWNWKEWYSPPEILALISDMLQNMRKTGCIVNGTVAHAIIVGVLQSLLPSVLAENGGSFLC
jgi:hypothetical protein